MRILLFVLCLVSFFAIRAQSVLTIEGKYTGENLYFQNPYASAGTFCTDSVTVNGKRSVSELNSTAFEVRVTDQGFKPYDSLVVKVYHKKDCLPRLLPAFVHHRSYIRILSIAFDSIGMLRWTIDNDSLLNKAVFTVEQYRWNKWVKVGEVEQTELKQTAFDFMPKLHSGNNKFRVKYEELGFQKYILSPPAEIESGLPEITYAMSHSAKKIVFSAETMYEIYSDRGDLLKKGFANEVDCTSLKKGMYYLNYDYKTGEIVF